MVFAHCQIWASDGRSLVGNYTVVDERTEREDCRRRTVKIGERSDGTINAVDATAATRNNIIYSIIVKSGHIEYHSVPWPLITDTALKANPSTLCYCGPGPGGWPLIDIFLMVTLSSVSPGQYLCIELVNWCGMNYIMDDHQACALT